MKFNWKKALLDRLGLEVKSSRPENIMNIMIDDLDDPQNQRILVERCQAAYNRFGPSKFFTDAQATAINFQLWNITGTALELGLFAVDAISRMGYQAGRAALEDQLKTIANFPTPYTKIIDDGWSAVFTRTFPASKVIFLAQMVAQVLTNNCEGCPAEKKAKCTPDHNWDKSMEALRHFLIHDIFNVEQNISRHVVTNMVGTFYVLAQHDDLPLDALDRLADTLEQQLTALCPSFSENLPYTMNSAKTAMEIIAKKSGDSREFWPAFRFPGLFGLAVFYANMGTPGVAELLETTTMQLETIVPEAPDA